MRTFPAPRGRTGSRRSTSVAEDRGTCGECHARRRTTARAQRTRAACGRGVRARGKDERGERRGCGGTRLERGDRDTRVGSAEPQVEARTARVDHAAARMARARRRTLHALAAARVPLLDPHKTGRLEAEHRPRRPCRKPTESGEDQIAVNRVANERMHWDAETRTMRAPASTDPTMPILRFGARRPGSRASRQRLMNPPTARARRVRSTSCPPP